MIELDYSLVIEATDPKIVIQNAQETAVV